MLFFYLGRLEDGEVLTNHFVDVTDDGSIYCVACEKTFRTEKAWLNHENSKKHKVRYR